MRKTIQTSEDLPPKLLWLLILTAAFTVGNIYISQPLLGQIGATFGRSPAQMGLMAALAQVGYVLSLLLVAPLGDVMKPRRLLLALLSVAGAVLVSCAFVDDFSLMKLAALGIGLSAVQAQIVLPYIASKSSDRDRGRNLGYFMSACLCGVLLSRTLSGFLGAHLAWRWVYVLWGLTMWGLALSLSKLLPKEPGSDGESATMRSYLGLVWSLGHMIRERAALRSIALTGSLMYGALSAFWATLAFYLAAPPFHLGTDRIGAFGLLGVGGAVAAGMVGRSLDRISARSVLLVSIAVMVGSFLIMGLAGPSLGVLIVSVVILDMAAQAANISNQSEIYRRYCDAQSRLNTIFKIFYFVGGALGSALSGLAWQHFGWGGVCAVGVGFLSLAWINVKRV